VSEKENKKVFFRKIKNEKKGWIFTTKSERATTRPRSPYETKSKNRKEENK
jgi:hypothetical protein